MLKTTHKHFLVSLLMLVSHFSELNLDPWPLNLFTGVLLSSLFLSLPHYCPRLTAFTSSAGFIWPLCQLRQIDPAASTQYAMTEVTVKITINHYNCHTGFCDFLYSQTWVNMFEELRIVYRLERIQAHQTAVFILFVVLIFLFGWIDVFTGEACGVQSFDPLNVFLIIVYPSSSVHVNWQVQLQRYISKQIHTQRR